MLQPDADFNVETIAKQTNPPAPGNIQNYDPINKAYNEMKLGINAYNLTNITKGTPPLPRYGHQACTVSKGRFLVIAGGRNNSIYKKLNNIALNDICLLNTVTFEWEKLALYGKIPASRWNHSLV